MARTVVISNRDDLTRHFTSYSSAKIVCRRGIDLSGFDLCGRDLSGDCFNNVDLSGADLRATELGKTQFYGSDLTGTCLDPKAKIPKIRRSDTTDAGLEIRRVADITYVYGWRTRTSMHVGYTRYRTGRTYTVPWFSVSTADGDCCHPGLYLAGKQWLIDEYGDTRCWRCRCKLSDLHHAGDKFRCRSLEILPMSEQDEA